MMFSLPLFKQSVRSNCVLWGAMTSVLSVLCAQFAALDMTQNLLFLIFYGMMTTILPGVYVLVTANKLIAGQVDRGSMAYVLSTPIKRTSVVFTQMVFLIGSLVGMFGVMTLVHLGVNQAKPLSLATAMGMGAAGGNEAMAASVTGDLTSKMILQVNLSALVVCIAMAAVCFAFSGIFSSSKYSIGLSGAFVGVTVLANMLAMFGSMGVSGLDKFKYLTICSFYDYKSVLLSGSEWIVKLIFPALIAAAAFTAGSLVFKKKDLPL